MPRIALAVSLTLAAALFAGSTTALAAESPLLAPRTLLDAPLAAPSGTHTTACHRAYRPNRPGVATRTVSAPGPGQLTIRLNGTQGDWDVAVFDAAGRALAADASPDAQEVALGYTTGGPLHIQACRRDGTAASAPATLEFAAIREGAAEKAKANPPQLVSVITPNKTRKDELLALNLDMTEHGGKETLGVVLHGKQDEDALRKAGFRWRVLVPDLVQQSREDRAADRRYAARATRSAFPSGRDTYRTLAEYNEELKTLAAENPNLVRLITLPNKTWMGKDVLGIEITENVTRNDGKPAFFNMGVHHAREWPSGEHAMEWGIELINGFKAGDARATNIVRNSRNIVVPIVNPDGFDASRTAGAAFPEGRDEAVDDTVYLGAGGLTGGEYRRKNCRLPDDSEAGNCTTSVGLAENGVDPNRNYGGLWGGPGADPSNPLVQTYRGPGPFSEPESRNVQWLVSRNQVMSLITNHTTAGLVLRAPGLAAIGDPVDENRGYKALGDDMAKHNGYFSQKSFELYDTTGTTEDWSYNATGGFGFTFEIYCGAPNYETGDCDDPAFHPLYETVANEWTGDNPQANHTLPGAPDAGFDGKGNREAYYIAAESALNEQRHSVLEGSAPAGATLRLTKQFKTETFPQPPDDKPLLVDDKLETTYDVGSDGRVRWHVNPSTRPIVAKATGVPDAGEPGPAESQTGGVAGSSTTDDDPDDGAAVATGEPESTGTESFNDHPITVPAGDNAAMSVRVSWPSQTGDWDVRLYADENGDGNSQEDEAVIGKSQTGPSNVEEVTVNGSPRLVNGTKYVLRVNNFAATAADNYEVDITYAAPPPFKPAQVESYTLTCEQGGRVFETQQVQIDRGQVKQLDLSACSAAIAAAGATPISAPSTPACASAAILRGVKASAAGSGVRFAFAKRVRQRVNVDVFQVAVGRRVVGERLVARFRNKNRSFTWNGRSKRKKVKPGYFFARYSIRLPNGQRDIRRKVLRLQNGRFTARPDFYRRDTCGLLRSYKLERPAFGGSTKRPLRVAFRLTRAANVRIQVVRGNRSETIVRSKRFAGGRTRRVSLRSAGLRKGDYRVRIRVTRAGSRTVTSTLTSRKL